MIEAAQQPSNFTATFTIKVIGINTTTIDNLDNVIKEVKWILIGKEADYSHELDQTTELLDPSPEKFISILNVTEKMVISWIEASETRLPGIKSYIQNILNTKLLINTPMPWVEVTQI